MHSRRRISLVIVVTSLLVLGGVVASAFARQAKIASGVTTLFLKVGDQIHIKGSSLACVVQNSSGTINLVCVEGSLSLPKGNSYATGIADKAASLNRISANGNSQTIVRLVKQPAISGATFLVRPGAAKSFTVALNTAILVGGTHIFCAAQRTDNAINVTCGLSSIAAKLQYPNGSYLTIISGQIAALAQRQRGGVKTLAGKTQP